MNLAQLLAVIRQDLHDLDSSNYRWTDAELTRHINRAVAELSESLPLPAKAALATVEGSRDLDISVLADRIMVAAVEYPVGATPPDYQQFSIWGDVLTITSGSQPDGKNCAVYYGAPHSIDEAGSTLPDKYMDLVAGGACGYAAAELALYTVNRVNLGGVKTPSDLLDWGNQKLNLFRRELKRLGRRNRIRVSDLSPAYYPAASKSTDYGP